MSELFQNYGFFILLLILFLGCHLFHMGGHGGHSESRDDDRDKRAGTGGHRH